MINKQLNFSCDAIIDPCGRFMKVNISLYNIVFFIASIYGPNVDDPSFSHTSHHSVSIFTQHS